MAVIALAILDDAFGHPEPGTTAGDHLVSGLVPVAIAGALALAYPRLRPGLRATVALVCGVLAMTAGVVDDDVMVMLAGIAGLGLVALGALTLWRTRRLDERPLRRYGRRALIGIAAAVVGFLVVFPVAFRDHSRPIARARRSRPPTSAVRSSG